MPTPSAKTFLNLKDRVLRFFKLQNDGTAGTVADEALRAAILRINSRPWKSMLVSEDITLTTAGPTVSVASDYNFSSHIFLLDSSNRRGGRIHWLPWYDFLGYVENIEGGPSGTPVHATIINSDETPVMEFDLIPTAGVVSAYPKIRHFYYRKLDHFTTDSDTLTINPEFENFLVFSAAAEFSLVEDPEKFPAFQAKADEAWSELLHQETRKDEMNYSQRGNV